MIQKNNFIWIRLMAVSIVAFIGLAWISPIALAQAPANTNPPTNSQTNTQTNSGGQQQYAAGAVDQSIKDLLCTPDQGDLYNCINKLYRFGIGIGVAIAVVSIVIAGYMYMTGGEKGLANAKGIIENTAAGLVILFIAFILLKQINPSLVTFHDIQLPTIAPPHHVDAPDPFDDPDGGQEPTGGSTGGGTSKDHPENSCATNREQNCVDLSKLGFSCNSGCWVQKALADKLIALKNASNPPFWHISEGYPPTGKHSDGCHATGACVDIGLNSGTFDSLCTAMRSVGLGVWNETGRDSGACGQDHTTGNTTGPHIHTYLTQ